MITVEQFKEFAPKAKADLVDLVACGKFVKILQDNGIRDGAELYNFLGQLSHESGGFSVTRENLKYSAKRLKQVWPKRFRNISAEDYAYNPQKLANRVYANRLGNGSEASGDGWRYAGAGFIQLTGKSNFMRYGRLANVNIVSHPERMQDAEIAIRVACAFWRFHNKGRIQAAARLGTDPKVIKTITKYINGGHHGLEDRTIRTAAAKKIFGGVKFSEAEKGNYPATAPEPGQTVIVPHKPMPTDRQYFVLQQNVTGGQEVVDLIGLLQAKLGIAVDGAFGPNTRTAVKNFQMKNGLTVDGVVGQQTWAWIMESE